MPSAESTPGRSENPQSSPPSFLASWLPYLSSLLAFGIYARGLKYDFLADDLIQSMGQEWIMTWSNIPKYFTGHVLMLMADNVKSNYYRPVFSVWFLLLNHAFPNNLIGWHLTSIVLHLVCSWLVFLIAGHLLHNRLAAGIAMLVFALHPIHIESVSYISAMTEPLVAAPMLASFLCYLRFREGLGNPKRWFLWALFLFMLSAFTKENSAVLPMIAFVYDWFYQRKPGESWLASFTRLVPGSASLAAVEVFYLACRIKIFGAMTVSLTQLTLNTRLLTIPSVFWFYVKHLCWPAGLSYYYDTYYISEPTLADFWLPLIASAFVILLYAVITWRSAHARALMVAAAFMVLPILPVLNISVFSWRELAHDRYLYIPSVGFSFALALAVLRVAALASHPSSGKNNQGRIIAGCTAFLALLMGMGLWTQIPQWENARSLYTRSVEVAPNNLLAVYSLAGVYVKDQQWPEATILYRRAVLLAPTNWMVHYSYGALLLGHGDAAEAEKVLRETIELDHGHDPREIFMLGQALMAGNKPVDAEAAYREALRAEPQSVYLRIELSAALKAQKKFSEARAVLEDALLLAPGNPEVQQALAGLPKK